MTHPDQPNHPNQAYVLTEAGTRLKTGDGNKDIAKADGDRTNGRSKPDDRIGRLFRHPSGQDELFDKSYEEQLEARRGEPVECLGLTFQNDEARRSHFLGRLREGLEELHAKLGGVAYTSLDDAVARMAAVEHWPVGGKAQLRRLAERMRQAESSKDLLQRWKDEVGFPHGEIEDILNLSDPPWHTACPNPFLGAFVEACSKPVDPDEPYRRKPFAVDVSEGKTHPVYRAHGYHTKVPHLAIVPSILHYTEPGDLVLDGFAGTGMTGVAAQWCGTAPESYRKALEALWAKEGFGKPNWGPRRTIQNDLSPLAGFIAANYGLPFDLDAFAEAGRDLLDGVEAELGWMYETLHTDGETTGRIDYTVWSEVFRCPECTAEVVFVDEALDRTTGRVKDTFPCPDCDAELNKDQYLSGVYYVGSQISEVSPRYNLGNKLSRLVKTFSHAPTRRPSGCVMTASTTASLGIPDNSVDYVFTDPPFGENIYYADLNFLVESWHGVLTNAAPEAIIDRFKQKGLHEYQRLMQRCFEEYQRVLKPGRWITVVFHNSRNAVWTAIQEAMLAAGFVVADVRTMDRSRTTRPSSRSPGRFRKPFSRRTRSSSSGTTRP